MVPGQACALVVGVVVLSLTRHQGRVESLLVHAQRDTLPVVPIGVEPGVRSAVTDPWGEPAMEMGRRAVGTQVRPHDALIDRDRVSSTQLVRKRDLNGLSLVGDDDATEVPL